MFVYELFQSCHKLSFLRGNRTLNSLNSLNSFILNVTCKFHEREYAKENVIAMDETPIWLDMPRSTTANEAGASSVTICAKTKAIHRLQRWEKRCM